jgi:AcrR family transcriptional regulator
MSTQYPLREQRKQRSRKALIDAAARLFSCQGFEATTLEHVAEAAGLHVQTLYRHFPNKAELAAAVDHEHLERFLEAFAERRTDTLSFWREWVRHSARLILHDGGVAYRRGVFNFYTLPSLSSTFLQTWNDYETALAEGLREDFRRTGADHDPRLPMLMACMLWGGQRRVVYEWAFAEGDYDLQTECLGAIDTVIAEFGHYLSGAGAG